MMKYEAVFGIHCGVSPGYGVKSPDYVELRETLDAKCHSKALMAAMKRANFFADDYLSDPETGLTTVRLLQLRYKGQDISFDSERAVVRRSELEHLIAVFIGRNDQPTA